MIKSIKHITLAVLMFPLLLTGCSDMFDKGDVDKSYDGPDVVGFSDLQSTVDEGTETTVEVQLISSNGVADSDVNVSISAEGDAPASTYSLSSNSVTIASGSVSAELTVTFPDNTDISDGDEVTLILNISSSDVEAEETLDSKTIFIRGVD